MLLIAAALFQEPLMQAAEDQPALAGYLLCVSKKAREFEASGETSEAVATTATTVCDGMVGLAAETLLLQADGYKLKGAERDRARADAQAMVRKSGHDIAVTAVVSKRSQSNAAN